MRHRTSTVRRCTVFGALALGLLVASASLGNASTTRSFAPSSSPPPPGQPAPGGLVGLYQAHFTGQEGQTGGTWHLRVGPGHHLKIWNRADPIANNASFEAGPVSFRGHRMVFAKTTAEGICTARATYAWTLRGGLLRFRLRGEDGCQPRAITFTPHPWRRTP